MNFKLLFFLTWSIIDLKTDSQEINQLEVEVHSKEKGGDIYLAVYTDNWLEKGKFLKGYQAAFTQTSVSIMVEIPDQPFAISVFHDLNGNKEMDKNFLGIPNEPYGFSNNVMGAFGPPDFQESILEIGSVKKTNITLR